MFGWIALAACHQAPETVETSEQTSASIAEKAASHLLVDVVARVNAPGEPAAWSAQVVVDPAPAASPVAGCSPMLREAGGARGVESLRVEGVATDELTWEEASGHWRASGPGGARDPAWSVGSLAWTDPKAHRAEGVIRFGGVPSGVKTQREREGAVVVEWDPTTADQTELLVVGPGGAVRCTATDGRVVLPWWATSPTGGEVVLRSTRTEHQLVDDVLVTARTTLERVITLDAPSGTTAEEKAPRFQPYSTSPPRRLFRAWKGPVG